MTCMCLNPVNPNNGTAVLGSNSLLMLILSHIVSYVHLLLVPVPFIRTLLPFHIARSSCKLQSAQQAASFVDSLHKFLQHLSDRIGVRKRWLCNWLVLVQPVHLDGKVACVFGCAVAT